MVVRKEDNKNRSRFHITVFVTFGKWEKHSNFDNSVKYISKHQQTKHSKGIADSKVDSASQSEFLPNFYDLVQSAAN